VVQAARARGATVLLVAHDLERGALAPDRVVTMADGLLLDDASVEGADADVETRLPLEATA
jgi:ABC-type uncharacterized transport system ATPase subunit